jgi:hypothetical protein
MNTSICDACGKECPATQQNDIPDGGWTLPIDTFGGYGLFDDDMDVAFGKKESRVLNMCHDCVVKFLTAFPLIGDVVGRGCHPNNVHLSDFKATNRDDGTLDKSCCKWAWTWKKVDGEYVVYDSTADGGWELAVQPKTSE